MATTVVIADDEQHIRLLMTQALEDLEDDGVELLTAVNGEEALAMVTSERPPLVFLDVMMPRMNGFDVCQAIKSDSSLCDTHVVLLTAKGQEFDRKHGLEVGADRYMTKPFDPDELLEHSRDVLGLK